MLNLCSCVEQLTQSSTGLSGPESCCISQRSYICMSGDGVCVCVLKEMPPKAHCILQHRGRRVIRQIKVFRGEIQSASFSEKLELLSHCKYLMPTGRDPGEVLLGQL